jgi:hypothetical protein
VGTYTFTHVKDGVLGKADDMLNPVGEDFELLERIPRKLPFRYGSHRGPQFTEKHEDVAVGENGYGPALQDWLRDERVKLDYER